MSGTERLMPHEADRDAANATGGGAERASHGKPDTSAESPSNGQSIPKERPKPGDEPGRAAPNRMRGMGRVYRRGGAYWIRYWAGTDRRESVARVLGKPAGLVTQRDAERLLKARLRAKYTGTLLMREDEQATVAEMLQGYLAHRELEWPAGAAETRKNVKCLTEWLGDRRVLGLGLPELEAAAREKRAAGWAPGTVKRRLGILHAAMRYWQRAGRLVTVPPFPVLRVDNARRGFVEPEQLDRIITHLPRPADDIARALGETGWRVSEILGLTWDQVDLRQLEIRLDESKTGKGTRPLIEGEPLLALLRRRHAMRALGVSWVFGRAVGRWGRVVPVLHEWFRRRWVRATVAAGVPGVLVHDLRRSRYRNLVMAGVDLATAMQLTRHKSLSVALRYQIQDPARSRAGLQRLEGHRAEGTQ